jgi:hypothetical protein
MTVFWISSKLLCEQHIRLLDTTVRSATLPDSGKTLLSEADHDQLILCSCVAKREKVDEGNS